HLAVAGGFSALPGAEVQEPQVQRLLHLVGTVAEEHNGPRVGLHQPGGREPDGRPIAAPHLVVRVAVHLPMVTSRTAPPLIPLVRSVPVDPWRSGSGATTRGPCRTQVTDPRVGPRVPGTTPRARADPRR